MESDYDRKFEEMKAYIPFLERMIARLDIGNAPINPRQAQLDKIKSLRDLLLNKKKRMKMENLLKCEQILITLHAKVEQRDSVSEIQKDVEKYDSTDLNEVRNKLKSVASRLSLELDGVHDATDIELRRNNEPEKLFQRRSNQTIISPTTDTQSDNKTTSSQSHKRSYTRVLHSPERSSRHWLEDPKTEIPLFSRRSPRKSSHRYSPSYKKEKKKMKKSKHTKLKDLNITLNVPEDKLSSLDTEDILPRIINCSDNDVDITTLRELRSQILGELKQTGVKDDISELLLKSCKSKSKNKPAMTTEIEEGELSDSESETIENIYGNLVITNKDASTSNSKNLERDKSRKIQICLVINSDKNEKSDTSIQEIISNKNTGVGDASEFQSFSEEKANIKPVQPIDIKINSPKQEHPVLDNKSKSPNCLLRKEQERIQNKNQTCEDIPQQNEDKLPEKNNPLATIDVNTISSKQMQPTNEEKIKPSAEKLKNTESTEKINTGNMQLNAESNDDRPVAQQIEEKETKSFVPNFYKTNQGTHHGPCEIESVAVTDTSDRVEQTNNKGENTTKIISTKSSVQIPLLDLEATKKQDIVSEIDILQALKKEILGETITTTLTDDTYTPALHQPKITKVARAQEIVKKRISIDNYKQKCNEPTNKLFYRDKDKNKSKDDPIKKQSLKLTEKECERFKLPIKLPLNDSSEDDDDLDIYSNLAPKSPDHEDFADMGIKPPIIIPSDPVKPVVVDSFCDVDMRNNVDKKHPPRTKSRWEDRPDNAFIRDESVVLPGIAFNSPSRLQSSMTPSRCGPNTTPSRLVAPSPSIMTSNISTNFIPTTPNARNYDMTPSCLDSDNMEDRKHVYAPMFLVGNSHERNEDKRIKDNNDSSVWETNTMPKDLEFDPRDSHGRTHRPYTPIYSFTRPDNRATPASSFGRLECPSTPLSSFGKMECPTTPLPSFGRMECPATPLPSFGRMECPTTPLPSFGRMECPTTPLPSFGRLECPTTPLPSFGRMECPTTPLPSFGRNERAMTPVNSFNCMEGSGTPAHSYGRRDDSIRYPYSERLITPDQLYSQFDGPSTPIHPYDRGDAPATPVHPFGRQGNLDTPSHSFGRLDNTGKHLYGRHDGFGTPSNSFAGQDGSGNNDSSFHCLEVSTTPSQSYSRTDYGRQYQPIKSSFGRNDPRLTRSSDFDNYKKREDNRGFYKEQNCNPDNSDRRGSDDYRRHKNRFGRNENRSNETRSDHYYKEFASSNDNFDRRNFNSNEMLSHRCKNENRYERHNLGEKSAERSYSLDHRAPGKSYDKDIELAGRSFHIDKSVNTSFQNFEQKKKSLSSFDNHRQRGASVGRVNNFDSRRQRAASVGRVNSFESRRHRAASVGRVLTRDRSLERTTQDNNRASIKSDIANKRKDFRRASSVGKELQRSTESFKSVKDDLRSFKIKNDLNIEKRFGIFDNNLKTKCSQNKNDSGIDIHKIDCKYPGQKTHYEQRYSPRKNYRDPRLRRESKLEQKEKHKNKSEYRYQKKTGIVYSDANISKGTILGPGCGVKNYKIPKIKRPPEITSDNLMDNVKDNISKEVNTTIKEEKRDIKTVSNLKISCTSKEDNSIGSSEEKNLKKYDKDTKCSKSDKIMKAHSDFRRITRSSLQKSSSTDSLNDDIIIKRDKCKAKPIIYDESESDTDEKHLQKIQSHQNAVTNDNRLNQSKEDYLQINTQSEVQPKIKDTCNNVKQELNENSNMKFLDKFVNNNATCGSRSPVAVINIPRTTTDSTSNFQQNMPGVETNEKKYDAPVITDKQIIISESPKKITKNDDGNSNFGDLEIFSDTIAPDPVLDNINALIADLDHDIDTVKSHEVRGPFKQDFLLDQMFDSIKEDTYIDSRKMSVENDIEKDVKPKKNSQEMCHNKPHNSNTEDISCTNEVTEQENNSGIDTDTLSKNQSTSSPMDIKTNEAISKNVDIENNSNEAVVSTTKDDIKLTSHEDNTMSECQDNTKRNRPDSTINIIGQHKTSDEIVPDSTNEPNECNDLISSSNSEIQNTTTLTVDSSQIADKTDTIGSFLSILQDKTKMRELLSILGKQSSENEKIKKKLEKISAIVSDDEENVMDCNAKQVISEKRNEDSSLKLNSSDTKEIEATTGIEKCSPKNSYMHIENVDNREEKEDSLSKSNSSDTKEIEATTGLEKCSPKVSYTDIEKVDTIERNEGVDKLNSIARMSEHSDASKSRTADLKEAFVNIENVTNITSVSESTNETKVTNKGRGKKVHKGTVVAKKRLTRSDAKTKINKPSRELLNLQADIREMFLKDDEDILGGNTGLRMCRLAKLVDEKSQSEVHEELPKRDSVAVVRMEKLKKREDVAVEDKVSKKKYTRKVKSDKQHKIDEDTQCSVTKERASPRDPYAFETDSVSESTLTTEKREDSAENDSDLESTRSESSEQHLPGLKKKPKRKRSAWQSGIILSKHKKKKSPMSKQKIQNALDENLEFKVPKRNCYIDKSYHFSKNITEYDCRLCEKKFKNIVCHFKTKHPHSEIPLSRISPDIALEAIKQCETVDFKALCQIPSRRYVCRFCFKQFTCKTLEKYFWHIVSAHTGEYKKPCTACEWDKMCPVSLDIPPPPTQRQGQLIGYMCGNCNYTQISLENIKTHVVTRHNDEQTEVYTINMSHMSDKVLNSLLKQIKQAPNIKESEEQRVLRSNRSCASPANTDDKNDNSDVGDNDLMSNMFEESESSTVTENPNIQSKITFENDSDNEKSLNASTASRTLKVKEEPKDIYEVEETGDELQQSINAVTPFEEPKLDVIEESKNIRGKDINELPHFKITYTESGSKLYVCCIKHHAHYKTALMISFKRHIQVVHKEKWDGYCCICKVIVMPQGVHTYKNCLDHFINKHLDNFPVLEAQSEQADGIKETPLQENLTLSSASSTPNTPKSFLSVRPLSELLGSNVANETNLSSPLPVIESVVSLGNSAQSDVSFPTQETVHEDLKRYSYEEAQADIMSKKNRIILDAMLSHDKLAQVFKCAGRFCSYTTNSAEDALLHVSTHSRIGGENALKCAYCDFDCLDNAIDLVTHVFKYHGFCQYVCGYCFYRAAAGQLVNAHIVRVHQNVTVKTVLKSTFTSKPIETSMLSREAAVPTYVCTCDDEDGSNCKFKTYTPGKLCEHIKTKHKDVTIHKCSMCNSTSVSVAELVQHYKSHGLKLYQCAWCLFGADTETELLAHSSSHHATCLPKAYLRVITNKEGTSEFRVLPLANLNISNAPNVTEVSTNVRENPVREAERSIDLEKLIGNTSFVESTVEKETPTEILPDEPSIADSMLNFNPEETWPCTTFAPVTLDKQSTPIIKSEVTSSKPGPSTDVICIDSDEDDTSHASKESTSSFTKSNSDLSTVPNFVSEFLLRSLYRCAKCATISKNSSSFKLHLSECFPAVLYNQIPCAFCSFKGSKTKLLSHYKQIHLFKSKPVSRTETESSINALHIDNSKKKQLVQNSSNIELSAKKVGGVTVRELTSRKNSKRKTSSETGGEPSAKVMKYGPHEVHQLPINPIFENFIHCSLCEFNTKVRLNMVRHLQLHANQQPVPQTAPVNPVPHLETNEMHFDRMLNLASSSLANRQDKNNKNESPTIPIPVERASWYPKYVHERTRHTCGAKGCSYISVDENMLKCHWETLHSGSTDFHCVHCPPYQTLDTKTPLTASRIIGHLKMHDAKLYACSQCTFYHFKRTVVDKHVHEVHKRGNVMVVREEVPAAPATIPASSATAAPTMDLKPWQCGLCEYKSLLRPEVIEHCSKTHNSKMQFKCVYCAFRTSNEENVKKHQSQSHKESPAVTFYFYYREGSIPNEPDGTAFWKIQKQKYSTVETKIKSEIVEAASSITTPVTPIAPTVNLSLVKQEVTESVEESIEDLCKSFGEFCEPNGLRYKCPLCKVVIEDTKEAMQSHLFEELQYRKWCCSICFYKAFHKRGLSEHMTSEHRVNRDPVELPVNERVENWVNGLLQYQETHIENCKKKLEQQKVEILKKSQSATEIKPLLKSNVAATSAPSKATKDELENNFGSFGNAKGMSFCCPKCNEVFKEESIMRNHLESELNKIRWCCSTCPETFTTYHQAQFHCKTHSGQSSRPVEAPRESTLRTAWVDAAIEVQKLSITSAPNAIVQQTQSDSCEPPENSLLVVRYEERIPTPEVQSALLSKSDSDDDRLVISEMKTQKRKASMNCEYCTFTCIKKKVLTDHILQFHYDLKSFTCEYCKVTGTIASLKKHQKIYHAMKPINIVPTPIPTESPDEWIKKKKEVPSVGKICLICQSSVLQSEVADHVHEDAEPEYGRVGEVIIKCYTCSTLHKDIYKFEDHKKKQHPNEDNYMFYKLTSRPFQAKCSYCPQKFSLKKDLKAHIETSHAEAMTYATLEPQSSKDSGGNVIVLDDDEETMAVVSLSRRKVARKSTSKLPFFRTVARKSTSKLPMNYKDDYSFYGSTPSSSGLDNVTTMMPFYNSLVPIPLKRLTGVMNINPKVVLTKLPKDISK